MSWKSTSVMEEKIKFIRLWKSGAYSVAELCRSFGISRRTAYRLIDRYEVEGEASFRERSRRPKSIASKTSLEVEKAIIRLRLKYPRWGARKIQKLLEQEIDIQKIPSEVTINRILARNNLVTKRKKRLPKIAKEYPQYEAQKCNEIWSADYKGKFRMGNSKYCYPLTVVDKKSRFILTAKAHYSPNYESVKREYLRLFKEFGMPRYIHTDNGAPFASTRALLRYSKLCYWLIDHDIEPLFSDLASPQQNGKHERMHRDLKAYCKGQIMHTLAAQQRVMDDFIEEYNQVRPHEALAMETPAAIHQFSDRTYKGRPRPYDYPFGYKVLKVMKLGAVRWGAYNWVYIASGASRKYVGFEEIGGGIWKVWYRHVFLGYMDEKQIKHREQYLKLTHQIV